MDYLDSRGRMEYQEEMVHQDFLALKENLPERASRVNVDQMVILVLLALQERGVPLVCQALVDQDRLEIRAVRGIQEFLDILGDLVRKVSQG